MIHNPSDSSRLGIREAEVDDAETGIIWGSKSIPELAALSPAKRQRAWKACVLKPLGHWTTCWASISTALLIYIVGWVACREMYFSFMPEAANNAKDADEFLAHMDQLSAAERQAANFAGLVTGIGYLLSNALALFTFLQLHIAQMRPFLRAYVKQNHPPPPDPDTADSNPGAGRRSRGVQGRTATGSTPSAG
ncbi:hypothetical protein OAS39_09940 [Pirellulales bacterium]|nr:hypothetical protein [Pirellulales bacterium]